MKLKAIASMAVLSVATSHAAVTISGTGATGVRNVDNTQLALGSLAIWIADTGNNGFGALTDKSVTPNSSLSIGELFGGDLIIGRVSSTQFGTAPNNGRVPAGWSYDNPAAVGGAPDVAPGTKFAIVWFSTLGGSVAAATTQTAAGMFYGVASFDDTPANGGWVTGTQTSGSLGFSTSTISAANPFKGFVAGDFSNSTTPGLNNAQAQFSVVPEPSAALLGAIGALGLLRRRRN